jgi:hypothetical protein
MNTPAKVSLVGGVITSGLWLFCLKLILLDLLARRYPVSAEMWIRLGIVTFLTAFTWFVFIGHRRAVLKKEPIQPPETTRGK